MRGWILMTLVLGLLATVPATAQDKYGGGNYGGGGSVTCESREGGYRECYSGFRNPPVLVRQLSDSNCVEGRSWGHRPGAIWVSKGCRGIFEESRGGGGGPRDRDGIVCESRDGRYVECRTGFRGPVQLVDQLSSSQCIEGRSWGRTRDGVWVDHGCRARFAEYYGGGGGRPGGGRPGGGYWEQSGDYTLECESKDGRYRTCVWNWNAGTPYLLDQMSSSPCVRGRSWGYDRDRSLLWVDQGCRAVFGTR
jgi:hypothetical protein